MGRRLLYKDKIGCEVTVALYRGGYTTGVIVSQEPHYIRVEFNGGRVEKFSKHSVISIGDRVWSFTEEVGNETVS